MIYSSFKRPVHVRKPAAPLRPVRAVAPTVIATEVISHPKAQAVYSEAYRRLVAALDCIHCGIAGYSQAAHPPPTGKGMKEDDRECFPLCCTRLLITACHVEFDNYRLVPTEDMRAQAARWGAATRQQITQSGQWPQSLPIFNTKETKNV